jgi:aspartate carbamoyltransferase regulatory subunit
MNIDSIKNGYVIDHITAGNAMRIYEALELNKINAQVAIITNAKSQKTGKKDIIKIDEKTDLDFNKLGFLEPGATVNVIENDVIIEKKILELPDIIEDVAKCKNPRCITSIERDLKQIFILTDRENKVYRCKYCESSLKNEA